LGAFVGLAVSGNSRKNSLSSSCAPFCSDAEVGEVRTRYILADVALGVGAASLVTAAALFFTRPESPARAASRPAGTALDLQAWQAWEVRPRPGGATFGWKGTF